MEIKINSLVTRKSYKNDIIFKVINIKDNIYYLKGENIRLYADSPIEDLEIYNSENNDNFCPIVNEDLERNEFFYIPAKILHLDSDISLSNDLLNPYKIRKKAKIQKYINHQKKKK